MPFDAENYVPATVDPRTLETPRERLIYLRDFLRELAPERFQISAFFSGAFGDRSAHEHVNACGTAACIAGWALALFAPMHRCEDWDESPSEKARGLLGLPATAQQLFFPLGYANNEVPRTPTQAAAVLTHLIETGEVDWSVA